METGLGKRAKKEHMSAICIKLLSHDPRTGETSIQVNNDVKSDGTAANGPSLYCMDPICEARPVLRGWETLRCWKLPVSYGRKRWFTYITVPDNEVSWGDTRVCSLTHLRRLKTMTSETQKQDKQAEHPAEWRQQRSDSAFWVGWVDCQLSSSAIDTCLTHQLKILVMFGP